MTNIEKRFRELRQWLPVVVVIAGVTLLMAAGVQAGIRMKDDPKPPHYSKMKVKDTENGTIKWMAYDDSQPYAIGDIFEYRELDSDGEIKKEGPKYIVIELINVPEEDDDQ